VLQQHLLRVLVRTDEPHQQLQVVEGLPIGAGLYKRGRQLVQLRVDDGTWWG